MLFVDREDPYVFVRRVLELLLWADLGSVGRREHALKTQSANNSREEGAPILRFGLSVRVRPGYDFISSAVVFTMGATNFRISWVADGLSSIS